MAGGGGARPVLGAAIGAGAGLALGAAVYTGLTPVLEAADGFVRELQGFVWNLVPMGTIGGAVVGWAVAVRRGRDGGGA